MQHMTITYSHEKGGLLTFNALGKTVLDSIKSNVLRIFYNDSSYTNLATASLKQNEFYVHKFQLIPYNYNKYASSVFQGLYGLLYDPYNIFNIYHDNNNGIRNYQLFTTKHSSFATCTTISDDTKKTNTSAPVIVVDLLQTLFNVTVKFSDSRFQYLRQYETVMSFTLNVCLGNVQNVIFIKHCNFEYLTM